MSTKGIDAADSDRRLRDGYFFQPPVATALWFRETAKAHDRRLAIWKFACAMIFPALSIAIVKAHWATWPLLIFLLFGLGLLICEYGYPRRLAASYGKRQPTSHPIPLGDLDAKAISDLMRTARFFDNAGRKVLIPSKPTEFDLVLFLADPVVTRLQSALVGWRLSSPLKHCFLTDSDWNKETAHPANEKAANSRLGLTHFFFNLDADYARQRLRELQEGLPHGKTWIGVYAEVAIAKVRQHPRAQHSEIKNYIEDALEKDGRWVVGRPLFETAHEVFSPKGQGRYSWVRKYFLDPDFPHPHIRPLQGDLGL